MKFSKKFVLTLYKRYLILHPFLYEYAYKLGVSYKVCIKSLYYGINVRRNLLFVDLDRTLIKSDFLLESFVMYFSQNIFAPILCLGVLITKGKVEFKKFLSNKSHISIENLPYNQQVLDAIYQWKENYPEEKVILISATNQDVIERIACHLKCFDGWYGTENENLKSEIKLKKIKDLTGGGEFHIYRRFFCRFGYLGKF